MKFNVLFSVILSFVTFTLISQDTITVQTLTYDSVGRDYMFDFPEGNWNDYEKIIMEYSMRCKGGLVSDASDRNKGCGEWDYSCNTYIIDSTRIDSMPAMHPSHIVAGYSGDVFDYKTTPTFDYTQYIQKQTEISIISENAIELNDTEFRIDHPLQSEGKASRSQYLYTKEELEEKGLIAGTISAINFVTDELDNNHSLFRIRMAHTNSNTLETPIVNDVDFVQVYFIDTKFEMDDNKLVFYEDFEWDGNSNLVIEYSFEENATSSTVYGQTSTNKGLISNQNNNFLKFNSAGHVKLSSANFEKVSSEITISLWSYGASDILPVNTTIFEGVDNGNARQANVHLPWSNGQVYWDCGNDGNYDRINKQANDIDFKGKWNHWAFTKNTNTGSMKIYLNGDLWHSGNGMTRPISLTKMNLGSDRNGNNPYFGNVDEFRIWDKELSAGDIKAWMHREVNTDHPNYENLISYYRFDEGPSTTLLNEAFGGESASVEGNLKWGDYKATEMITNFVSVDARPSIILYQGQYDRVNADIVKLDTFQNDNSNIKFYEVSGTDIVQVNEENWWQATDEILRNEEGEVLESYPVISDGSINISGLDYYNKLPSRFEIMSFVTPYGIFLDLGQKGKTWTFDVTDFGPILTGNKRMFLGNGGQNQEEMDIKFHFIKGTPPRDVLDVRQIWRPGSHCNYINIQADNCFEPKTLNLIPEGEYFKVRSMITGHGQEGEFIPRTHSLSIEDMPLFFWEAWTECADNPVYPQGGTWIYDRAGWCPGAATDLYEWDLTPFVDESNELLIDYNILSGSGDSRYLINHQLVTYGPYNYQVDATISDILNPTDKIEYARNNPGCVDPTVVMTNTGSEIITSATIKYSVGNNTPISYDWTGSVDPSESIEISLPVDDLNFYGPSGGKSVFTAEITTINGSSDEYLKNNTMSSEFTIPDIVNKEMAIFTLKANNIGNQNRLKVTDFNGNVLINRANFAPNQIFRDTILLENGCYSVELTDSGHDGLDFWANPNQGTGYLFISDGTSNIKNIEPDFGSVTRYSFIKGDLTNIIESPISNSFEISPNPTNGIFNIQLHNFENPNALIFITDMTGSIIKEKRIRDGSSRQINFDLSELPKGIYNCTVVSNKSMSSKKIVKL